MSEQQDLIMEQEKRRCIASLMPVIDERYQSVRAVLARMEAGEDAPYWELDLARRDLLAALDTVQDVLNPPDDNDEEY